MWKDYSVGYVKNNRASSISIMLAALISTLLLSFLCSLFYNSWQYEIERIILEEGDWQGRIIGEISVDDLSIIQNFANVERIVVNEKLTNEQETAVDIYFKNARTVFREMPLIIERLGLEEGAAYYHLLLLSRYLIHDPQDETPPLLLTFYVVVLLIVSLSLILVIHNSFAVSMNSRIHQFGIFSSIGASPGQIITCLMQEAAVLCLIPIFVGGLSGIALCYGAVQAMNILVADMAGRLEAVFQYHPLVFVITILLSALTVLFSAWLPARKLSKLTPLQAIRDTGVLQLKKKKNSHILSLMFGMEGELAGNALKAQKKALRTSTLSLTLSFLGFMWMLCFNTLSDISTRYTYFERYQHVWDIIVTIKDTKLEDFGLMDELQGLEGVRDCIVYQKAVSESTVVDEWQSEELIALGGLGAIAGADISKEDSWLVKAPIVIMDDAGFTEYCEQIGIMPRLDGAIAFNLIWDSLNSNFRYKSYIPYVEEKRETIVLRNTGQERDAIEIPVIAYTREVPVLREEYDNYAFVQFISLSLWKKISGMVADIEPDVYIRILAEEGASLTELNELEENVAQMIGQKYESEIENRIQEKITNDYLIWGYKIIMGALCSMLALIGIANVFSNTLGFLCQRKREIAQYISVGMTPLGIWKMFSIEALLIVGRPLLITLSSTVLVVGFMITASYLDPMVFIAEAPIVPIFVFSVIIFGFVTLAYYLGGKKVLRYSLSDTLRDDTMV